MRYFTDTTQAEQLNLSGTTLMVFSTLQCLCAYKPWTGSSSKLSELSRCGGKMTAYRAVLRLVEMNLVSYQNETGAYQIVTKAYQNDTISKEKKYQEKKNKIKENKVVVVEKKDVPSQPQPQPKSFFNPPSWEEVVTFGSEKGMSISLVKKFYAYYSANNWMLKKGYKMENWKGALVYWHEKEKETATKAICRAAYGQASNQEQASFAGAQYAEFLARQQQDKQQDQLRQADEQQRYVSYEEYKQSIHH